MAPRMDVSDISEVYTGGAIAKPPPPIGKKGKILVIGIIHDPILAVFIQELVLVF